MGKKFCVGLGFTNRCNMNCPFCYSKEKRNDIQKIDMPVWKSFIDRNHSVIDSINYGTGENSIVDEWYEFLIYIRSNYPNIKQALTTNGSLANYISKDNEKKRIVLECIDEIDVSIDFGDKTKHNYARGNDNAFDWAIQTLLFCNQHHILPTIVVLGTDETLSKENMTSIFDIAEKYDSKVRINLYRPVDQRSPYVPPQLSSILSFFDWVNENHAIASISDPLFSALLTDHSNRVDPSGQSSVRITHDGNIYPSTYLLFDAFLMGNIESFDLERDFDNNPVIKRIKESSIPDHCQACTHSETCHGGVIDRRYLWYRRLDVCDPYCFVDNPSLHRHYLVNQENFSSVHDDYLPTLFFIPKSK